MATTSMQFGQSAINVVIGEGHVPAKLATDASGNVTGLVGPDGNNVLDIEQPSGNLLANVNLRSGTLDSLIALDGGASEVSRPTDANAIVLHNGNANQAKTIHRTGQIGTIASFSPGANTTSNAIPSGATGRALKITSTPGDQLDTFGSAISAGLDEFSVPSTSARPAFVVVETVVNFGASAAGTVRSVELQYDLTAGGVWITLGTLSAAAAANQVIRGTLAGKCPVTSGSTGKFRLLCKQDSGADMDVALQWMEARVYRLDR